MTKNVECPYCGVKKNRQVLESDQVSHGWSIVMHRFKCDDCGKAFWKYKKVQK